MPMWLQTEMCTLAHRYKTVPMYNVVDNRFSDNIAQNLVFNNKYDTDNRVEM